MTPFPTATSSSRPAGPSSPTATAALFPTRGRWGFARLLATTAIVLGLGAPVAAQQEARGWIGFSYEAATRAGASGEVAGSIVVTRVVEGSPADRAGFQPGDRLLRVNQRRATPAYFREVASRLRPGDRVTLTLSRNGWEKEISLEAAPRPDEGYVTVPRAFVIRVDSAIQRLDSLQIRLRGTSRLSADTVHLARMPGRVGMLRFEGGSRAEFEAILRTRSDSLPGAVQAVLRLRPGVAVGERMELRADSLDVRWFESVVTSPDSAAIYLPDPEGGKPFHLFRFRNEKEEEDRPSLLPYITGRSRVAGAELTPLNPGLAEYFQAAHGLLVTDVTEGTPASDAGLVPGDVIIRADDLVVSDLMTLRTAIARAGRAIVRLEVVRKGERREILLGR